MTETEARQVLLLQAHEQHAQAAEAADRAAARWSTADRAWATRQAVAEVGDRATPEVFVTARAAVGLRRLLPRDAAARRWLERRAWHGAWVWLAALLGLGVGLLADQLGQPQHVNLLAPAVWAVVAWNLLVYAGALLPWPHPPGGLQQALVRWPGRGDGRHGAGKRDGDGDGDRSGDGDSAAWLWARHAAPLSLARAALVLHVAAAMLAAGLIAGLYLRGLVLDYRAGWQSTFLDAPQVQAVLGALLAPASAVTGIAVPDVAVLRVGPGAPAQASAAPWIHLYATTLLLWVVLPRALLAAWAGRRAARLARRFPLALDTPYFESLHPLMRPDLSRTLRLLWVAPPELAPVTLLGQRIAGDLPALQPLTLLRSDAGDGGEALQLLPAPPDAALDRSLALASNKQSWWQLRTADKDRADPAVPPPAALRQQIDAVLWVARPGAPYPAWLAALQRPVLVLHDAAVAEPPALPLRKLAAGWLADGRWLQALQVALPDDGRVQRLAATWEARQQAGLDAVVTEIAASLARVGAARAPLADDRLLARRSAAEAAQQALAASLQLEWQGSALRLSAAVGPTAEVSGPGPTDAGAPHAVAARTVGAADGETAVAFAGDAAHAGASHDTLPSAAALRARVGEGSAAVVGGVASGALAGLKADIATGGMTMGAGLVVGALLGAAAAAGLARGVNVVRGTDRSFVAWDAQALAVLTEAWLLRHLAAKHPPDAARSAVQAALQAQRQGWAGVWKSRSQRFDNAGEDQRLAEALHAPLAAVLRDALARLHAAPAGAAILPPDQTPD